MSGETCQGPPAVIFFEKQNPFSKRCHEKYLNDEFVDEEPSNKRFRESRGGRKCKASEVREAMFEWFINV